MVSVNPPLRSVPPTSWAPPVHVATGGHRFSDTLPAPPYGSSLAFLLMIGFIAAVFQLTDGAGGVARTGAGLMPESDCHSQGEGYQEQDYEGRQVHGLHK